MNIIQELTKKYGGKYEEDLTKSINTSTGRYTFQPKKGVIEIGGTKITININEVSGATPVTEPFRIILHLDKKYNTKLTIFPKDLWNEFLDFMFPKRRSFISKSILKQFWFGGNKELLKQLASDKIFTENILNERIYIETLHKPTNQIVLTPEYGIKNIDQFEKFVSILKRIENKIKTTCNTKQ